MSKSNGKRSVNKTDGPKKLGKKQMTKSRRSDTKKDIENIRFQNCASCGVLIVFPQIYCSSYCYEVDNFNPFTD